MFIHVHVWQTKETLVVSYFSYKNQRASKHSLLKYSMRNKICVSQGLMRTSNFFTKAINQNLVES